MHLIFTLPANMFIDKFGVKKSIMMGSIFCITGCLLRLLINQCFTFLVLGSIIYGIGYPFIINVQGKIVSNWFLPKDRVLVTSLLSFIVFAFTLIGLIFPEFIFADYSENDA